jgi:hypothetical protein
MVGLHVAGPNGPGSPVVASESHYWLPHPRAHRRPTGDDDLPRWIINGAPWPPRAGLRRPPAACEAESRAVLLGSVMYEPQASRVEGMEVNTPTALPAPIKLTGVPIPAPLSTGNRGDHGQSCP